MRNICKEVKMLITISSIIMINNKIFKSLNEINPFDSILSGYAIWSFFLSIVFLGFSMFLACYGMRDCDWPKDGLISLLYYKCITIYK